MYHAPNLSYDSRAMLTLVSVKDIFTRLISEVHKYHCVLHKKKYFLICSVYRSSFYQSYIVSENKLLSFTHSRSNFMVPERSKSIWWSFMVAKTLSFVRVSFRSQGSGSHLHSWPMVDLLVLRIRTQAILILSTGVN